MPDSPLSAEAPAGRPLLSLAGLTPDDLGFVADLASEFGRDPGRFAGLLAGSRVGLLFTAPSTRTRTSFWSAATTLGCHIIHFGPGDIQVSTGETWFDTGSVLATYLDAVVARTNGPQADLEEMATAMPAVVNALTKEEHPTQSVADLSALREYFGPDARPGIAYLGPVNNTARSLAQLVSLRDGMRLDVYSPAGHGLGEAELVELNRLAGREAVRQFDTIPAAPEPVDAVYTCRWQSMGSAPEGAGEGWIEAFRPFAVSRETLRLFGDGKPAVFLHDLPAIRGQEATSDVLDGEGSLVARQVFHKRSAAAAALIWTLRGRDIG
ncbi:ornithine carbamoyltransferase [Micromonospora sp. CPCC 205561]|uniref:ornithine carbamoyltransferase n=1 Tax=Micromonospora sp. CPCC 205561 TaxID=3122407 RepID=UPI002FEEF8FB